MPGKGARYETSDFVCFREEDGILDFQLTDCTEFTGGTSASVGDTVEVDYALQYATDTRDALVVTLVG